MNDTDRRDYIERYEGRLREFGYSPETLGWGKQGRQHVRFAVLAEPALRHPTSSVLDVGCGFADLHNFLVQKGWRGAYTGVDIVPGLLQMARERRPDLDLREMDLSVCAEGLGLFDFVIASGVLNAALKVGDNAAHIAQMVGAMWARCRVAVCVDFMSTYVDFRKPGSWHTDPAWALGAAKRLSRRVLLRHDYMPFEFALFIFKDDAVSEQNVFRAFEGSLM